MNKRTLAAIGGFLCTILAANYVTSVYGLVPVGFGLTATAGTYFAGLSFVLRDAVQDTAGKAWTFATIIAGAGLSLALSPLFTNTAFLPPGVTAASIAIASGIAFMLSETADLLVYTPLRKCGYVRAAVASNIVGAFVDTYIFLTVSGFGLAVFWPQIIGKLTITLAVVTLIMLSRIALKAKHAESKQEALDPDLRASLEVGLEQSAQGDVHYLGSFAEDCRNPIKVSRVPAIEDPACTACDYGYPASACSTGCKCGAC